MQETPETWVQSLGREDYHRGGNGNPLQHSCLENPMDRGAWWATIQEATKSRTRLNTHMRAIDAYGKATCLFF